MKLTLLLLLLGFIVLLTTSQPILYTPICGSSLNPVVCRGGLNCILMKCEDTPDTIACETQGESCSRVSFGGNAGTCQSIPTSNPVNDHGLSCCLTGCGVIVGRP